MNQPRIPPGTRRDIGIGAWLLIRVLGLVARTEPPKLFSVLARHRPLFRGWLSFARRLMPGGTLPRRETELVILRVALLRGCSYELAHHRRLGERAGVTDADLARLVDGSEAEGWPARDRAVLRAAESMIERHDVDDRSWDELREHLDERECVELCLLVAHYDMLATVISTLRISPDLSSKEARRERRRR
ncbi:AhpD family alkylhydroperoxidase [Herbihabitans rhizosphaerae]|uniref:AhpD family alkylhydroperoxidase n=1 Tax=Herbihabitans rhizosphaerae TaxID=1872711 RepID=A0A4Q7KF36_9PSEU|nr:carboxymuconolactone decarboxylase family protein [Herbihabitans rhizosphaerae]RZS31131.1 AhpD family alkylhydroperoxidase [Herbihabitans rhizosphaerae]